MGTKTSKPRKARTKSQPIESSPKEGHRRDSSHNHPLLTMPDALLGQIFQSFNVLFLYLIIRRVCKRFQEICSNQGLDKLVLFYEETRIRSNLMYSTELKRDAIKDVSFCTLLDLGSETNPQPSRILIHAFINTNAGNLGMINSNDITSMIVAISQIMALPKEDIERATDLYASKEEIRKVIAFPISLFKQSFVNLKILKLCNFVIGTDLLNSISNLNLEVFSIRFSEFSVNPFAKTPKYETNFKKLYIGLPGDSFFQESRCIHVPTNLEGFFLHFESHFSEQDILIDASSCQNLKIM